MPTVWVGEKIKYKIPVYTNTSSVATAYHHCALCDHGFLYHIHVYFVWYNRSV